MTFLLSTIIEGERGSAFVFRLIATEVVEEYHAREASALNGQVSILREKLFKTQHFEASP